MLLNMVMFKVTICDFRKMNINMTDKIEKRSQPLQCRTMARTTTTMWTVRWCSILSMFLSVRCSLKSAITFGIHLIFSMRRNSMRRQDCITMWQDTMTQGWACGFLRMHYFDLGTEILDQSRQLKISGAEKITDKVIEEKDSKNNNTKDNK